MTAPMTSTLPTYIAKCIKKYCHEQKKTGRQNHALTRQKMLHCKMVVNIITYHHVV
jgi:polyhydroxyalkanoate synthesis regulator protein